MENFEIGIQIARVSSKDQATKGYSLSSQVRLLNDYADNNNISVAKRFIIPESASGKLERKLFTEALDYANQRPQIKIILCEKVDRITRNFSDALKINDWLEADETRRIHFVKQNLSIHKYSRANEKFQWDIHVVLARQYTNNLSEEVVKGLSQKALEGWYPGNKKRGYKLTGVSGKRIWIVDESPDSQVGFIKKAFNMYVCGKHTIDTVRNELFKEGWVDLRGNPIARSVLHKILSDCFYCGEFVWKGQHYYKNVKHPAIISKSIFDKVQKKLKRNLGGKYRKHSFIFGNLLQCGGCGYSVIGEVQKGHKYYKCSRHDKTCKQRKYIREEQLEKQFINEIGSLRIKDDKVREWVRNSLKNNHDLKKDYHNSVMTKLTKQYSMIERRMGILYDDKTDGNIPLNLFNKKLEQYSKELNDIDLAIKKHRNANIDYYELSANIFEISQHGIDIYKKSEQEKRNLLRFLFSKIVLKNGTLQFDYKNGFHLISECSKINEWLGLANDFRTMNWSNISCFKLHSISNFRNLLHSI